MHEKSPLSLLRALSRPLQQLRHTRLQSLRMKGMIQLPTDAAAGDALVQLMCEELGMHDASVVRWRQRYYNTETIQHIPLWQTELCDSERQEDRDMMRWAVAEGGCVISPFVCLSEFPSSGALAGTTTLFTKRRVPAGVFLFSLPSSLVFEATPIEGVSASEMATQLLIKDDHYIEDEVLRQYMRLEDIALQVAADVRNPEGLLHIYSRYIADTVVPPANLPFMSEREILGDTTVPSTKWTMPQFLWYDLHKKRNRQPLNLAAFRQVLLEETTKEQIDMAHTAMIDKGITAESLRSKLLLGAEVAAMTPPAELNRVVSEKRDDLEAVVASLPPTVLSLYLPPLPQKALDEYHWLLSIVLSRRCGDEVLIPLVDKLNHCVGSDRVPNTHFTMAKKKNMIGIDVFDNILAGVPSAHLYDPYVHVFALTDIPKGVALTTSYCDIDPNTAEGDIFWKSVWGFVPAARSGVSDQDLSELSAIVSERRVEKRAEMFPRPK